MSSDKTELQPQISHWPCRLDMNHEPLSAELQKHVSNAKERGRTTRVNVAFSMLRTCIPTEPRDRKLSKVETLRLATSYIGHLTNVIRARSEQDYGGEVCRRYGHSTDFEMERLAPKQICTFCLTDRRRCHQLTEENSQEKNAIVNLRLQKNLSIYPQPTFKSEVHLHPICPQHVPCRIKKEPDESCDEGI